MKKILLFASFLTLLSCNPESKISGIEVADSDILTDIKSFVSFGQSRTFNNRTAGMNDLELNPVTKNPAVAFYDRDQRGTTSPTTIGALKYAEMDASGQWNIEIIDVNYGTTSAAAACGVVNTFCIGAPNATTGGIAQVINLAFKSDGSPVIAYVFGASLTTPGEREIRLAERDSDGVWTVSRAYGINNGGAATEPSRAAAVNSMTGLTLLIDPSDRPHITFALYTTTNTSSKIKYLFRDSSGSWTSSDIMNAITGVGTITAITHGSIQAGGAWCSEGTDSATPTAQMGVYSYQVITAAAGASAHPVYINCTAVASSGACSSWNTLNLVNGCAASTCVSTFTAATNAGNRIDISIEPTSKKPLLALYSVANPTTQLGTVLAPAACNLAQTSTLNAWGTMSAIDLTANTAGLNGLKIHALNASDWVASYNVTTTVTRIMRTSSGQTGWAALAGHTIETSTVGAEGIGLAYDDDNENIFVSWGSGSNGAAGAVTNDLKVGSIRYSDIANGTLAGFFNIDIIDNTGNAFPNPTAGSLPLMSAAVAPNGLVGYSYFYVDPTGADMKLYYGVRYNTSASPLFMETQVVNFQEGTTSALAVGLSPSLSFDSSSNPVIAFYNGIAAEQNLNVARSSTGNSFSYSVVDDTVANVGSYASSATFGTAIGISYKDITNTSVKFARWTPTDKWRRFTVDGNSGAGGTGCSVANASGDFSKLALTSTGRPVIAYQDDTVVPAVLRVAVATEAITSNTFTWTCITIDNSGIAGVGRAEGIDIVLDSQDRPHITHFDAGAGTIRYVTSTLSVVAAVANGSSSFDDTVVATVGVPVILSAYTTPSIQINSSGTVFITFHDKNNVRYGMGSKMTAENSFTLETIEGSPIGGSNTSTVGSYGDLLLNDSSQPMIFYASFGGFIKYFSRESL